MWAFIYIKKKIQKIFCFERGFRPLNNSDGTNPDVDLFACFDYIEKIDTMNGDNQMYFNIFNKLYDVYYSTLVYSTPFYLIINLNILNYVVYKDGPTFFQLYAIICH